jgi:DNA adenine methylase
VTQDGRTDGRTEQEPFRTTQQKPFLQGDKGVVAAAAHDVPQKPLLRGSGGMGVTSNELDERYGEALKAPFPWFGGKSRAAEIIWRRLGDVDTYNEPFAGSLAVLLARPHTPRVETVNDLDSYLANFWRALQAEPNAVAYHADYPVNETDLHARHLWLVQQSEFQQRMKSDPHYYDAKIAGWWVWGQCLWIGSGWCSRPEWTGRGVGAAANRGVHNQQMSQQKPLLRDGSGMGILRDGVQRRWQGGGQGGGSGVHAPSLSQQKPADGGRAKRGLQSVTVESLGLYEYLLALSTRLRRVRVCCGDWKRVLTPSVTTYVGLCGVLLDPPYAHDMRERCYSEDHDISSEVRNWALEHGDDPAFRIALCGYEGEHDMPESWECVPWKAHGGYARTERGKENRERERIWFSPHCLKAELPLFAMADPEAGTDTGEGR